jgi:hypothetical protein
MSEQSSYALARRALDTAWARIEPKDPSGDEVEQMWEEAGPPEDWRVIASISRDETPSRRVWKRLRRRLLVMQMGAARLSRLHRRTLLYGSRGCSNLLREARPSSHSHRRPRRRRTVSRRRRSFARTQDGEPGPQRRAREWETGR